MTRLVFGVDPPPPATGHGDGRYQQRHKAALAAGVHPLTKYPLRTDGTRCGTCAFVRVQGMTNGTYYKCAKAAYSRGPATDLRLRWPACVLYEAHGEQEEED